jgi:autotransporter-associated beta strand protein
MNIAIKRTWLLTTVAGLVLALSGKFAPAAIITQWSFNSTNAGQFNTATNYGPNYDNPGTPNSPTPSTGVGLAKTLGMTNPYNGGSIAADDIINTSGTANPTFGEWLWRVRATTAFAYSTTASPAPNILPNGNVSTNGWALYNISNGTAHDGAPEYTQGIELDSSTVGYSNIQFSFDWYSTTQGIRDMQFQYNLNSSNSAGWTSIGSAIGAPAGAILNQSSGSAQNYVFVATPNDFYGGANPQTITVNLSTITGASNDPNLGIRLVAAFDDTNKYHDYVSATLNGGQTQLYNNSSGNWRLGNLTFIGALTLDTSFAGPQLTWNTGSGTWDTNGSNMVWLDSESNSAAFANGSVANFGDISSGTSSTITVSSSGVVAAGVAVNNTVPGTGYIFTGGAISGTGAFYMRPTNVGFVSLSGTNSYTGGTQISGGTLIAAGDSSLGLAGTGAGGAVVVDNGATLQLASGLTSGRLFEIGSNGGVLDTQGFSFSTTGSFFAGGNFTQLGSGTVSLSGAAVQLSGSTSFAAGALVLNGTSGASLQGGATLNGNLVVTQPERVNFDNGGTSGIYGGSGQIQVTFAGSGGTKAANASNAWVVLTDSATGSSTAANGTVVSGGTISNNISLNALGVSFTASKVTNTFAFPATGQFVVGIGATTPGNVIAFTGNISGSSDVVLGSNSINGAGGAGTLFLSGSNTWAGTTMIDGNGVIQLGSTAALPRTTDVIFGATDTTSATLDLNGFNQTINSLSAAGGTGSITNSSGASATLTVNGSITPKTGFNGAITGNLGLYKDGTGGLALSGSSTYSGATTIARGTVTVGNTSPLGVGPLFVQSSGTLISSGALTNLANSGGTVSSGAAVLPGGASAFGTLAFNSLALNGGNLSYDFNTTQSDLITGTGMLDLSGASLGSIVVNINTSGQTFNSYPLLTFNSLTGFNAANFAIGSGTKTGYTYGFVQDPQNSNQIDLTITGTGSNNLPTRQALTWATSTGNWNTTDVNWTASSGTASYVDGEAVTFGEPTANNSVVTISGSAVTPLSVTFSNSSNSYTVSGGSITGTTSLVKTGAGLVTLSTSNSYTGGTFVNGGTLATGAPGNAALGATSGGVTLDTNGTLQFTTANFSSARAITVNSGGGTIVASAGTAAVSGNLSVAANGAFSKAGSGVLNFTGNVTSGTGSSINVATGTLALIPENFTDNGQVTVSSGATLFMLTKTATSANSKSVTLGSTDVEGKVAITNPISLQFSGPDVTGTGSIQFQNMQTPPAPTHFSTASAQGIQLSGGPFLTQNINCNIQLNSLNSTFYKTSISQSGAQANGNGFILGNGTADSFFFVYPGSGNTINFNGVISGSCDVQFGSVGGGGQANTIYLNNQNTYAGVTMFEQGVSGNVILGASNALPRTTDLIFAPVNGNSYQQLLDLNGHNQTVASMSYWANANTDGYGNGYTTAIQVVNSNPNVVTTLTVSGAASPSRPYGGIIGDTGNGNLVLVKDGPNTLWLNGSFNSYTGGTTVKNGMLLLSPSSPLSGSPTGQGDVTITGGTLQGTATIQGNLIVGSSGTVRPGLANSLVTGGQPGTLGVTLDGSLSSGANCEFDIGAVNKSVLNVTDVLTLPTTGSARINLIDAGGLNGIVPLMTYGMLGNSFSTSQLSIGSAPDVAGAYAFRSTGGTGASGEIDLIAPNKLTWTGSAGTAWDTNNTANFSVPNQTGSSVFNANFVSYGVKDHVTFNDTGSGGTVAVANVGVEPLSVVFSNSAKSYTLSGGPILGGTSLSVSGGGLVTLATSNGYTGATTVNSGTLQLGTGVAGQDGSIDATSGVTIGGGSKLAFDLAGTQTVSYPISGNGSVSMIGPGELILSGNHTYLGGTAVRAGTVIVTEPSAIADGTNVTVGSSLYFPTPAPTVTDGIAGASVAAVPEPGTFALLAAGIAIVAFRAARRRNK